jgi:hypothetical protein
MPCLPVTLPDPAPIDRPHRAMGVVNASSSLAMLHSSDRRRCCGHPFKQAVAVGGADFHFASDQLNSAGTPSLAWIAFASRDPMPRAEPSAARYSASFWLSRSMPRTETA